MPYVFDTSERTTSSGNVAETKALLHLLCFDDDRDEIDAFAIDCFNDVTGMNSLSTALFDVQSKATSKTSPQGIGKDLVTLYKNYLSEFAPYFRSYTLFLGGVSSTVLQDASLSCFGFDDMQPKAQVKVRDALLTACSEKTYIDDSSVTDESIDRFLGIVKFTQSMPADTDYIRPLIRTSAAVMPDDRVLQRIFNEIRDSQSHFKNRPSVSNKAITVPSQVWDYSRVLRRRQIELLVIERVINRNPMKDPVPESFNSYLQNQVPEDEEEVVEDCRNAITLQYFDKNNKEPFWRLLDAVVTELDNDPDANIEDVYNRIDSAVCDDCEHLNRPALLYFIANIKDGVKR